MGLGAEEDEGIGAFIDHTIGVPEGLREWYQRCRGV